MKSGHLFRTVFLILVALALIVCSGCSSDSSSGGGGTDDDTGGETGATIAALDVQALPDSINPNETTTIEAFAYDASGNPVANATVIFTLDSPSMAMVTATGKTSASGAATATFTAREKSGQVNVSATSGTVTSENPATVTISGGAVPATISLTIAPASVVVEGSASVRAEVLDANGDPVTDGTVVSFSSNNTLFGDFSSATATTTNGFAAATFQAGNEQGTAVVTVRSGALSQQGNIIVFPAEATSVEFVSVAPQRIALQGSGGVEVALVEFVVKDSNGNPLEGEPVFFEMDGPNGGEKIDPTPNDPTPGEIEVSTDADGIARVRLLSGGVAGPVTITARINTVDSQGNTVSIESESSIVSIGGGTASDKRFSVAASRLNLPALEENNVTTSISAYLADRFGNYNVLDGTSVSFIIEKGLAILASNVTANAEGIATVEARTQRPYSGQAVAEDVAPETWETQLLTYIQQTYGVLLPGHPRDGLCSAMVYVKGEEHFEDENANGVYDAGEVFFDTDDDPFVDYNDDSYRDDGIFDPFEEYIDAGTGNGVWDGPNGVWDSDKNIFTSFRFLLTGKPYLIAANPTAFNVPNGGSVAFSVIVCDRNGNTLVPGSTINVSSDKGTLIGGTSWTLPDTNLPGPTEFTVALTDSDPDETNPEPANITVEVTWSGEYSTLTQTVIVASGTVN